ncbi:MAG TPA: hypothetical protein VHS99_23500 [Chloroflexota bacterium]|jgi:multiple sugar transport system substrate-binding protein|nr:hypothetical protein [Chloroflexota bacterium]
MPTITAASPAQTTPRTRRAALLAGMAGGAALTAVGACGVPGGQGAGAQPTTTSRGPATVVFNCVFASGERFDRYNQFFQQLNQERRDVQVEVRPGTGNYQTHREKIILEHVAGTPTDFYDNGWGPWTDMVTKGVILDLTPFIRRDRIDLNATFIPETVNAWTYEGKVFAWPHAVSGDTLAVNQALFDAAGLKYPPVNPDDKSWTMEQFQEYAVKLTRPPDQFGWGGAINGYNPGGVTEGTYFGQPAWDDKTKKCQMNQPRFKQGLQFFLDLRHRWKVFPDAEQAAALVGPGGTDIFNSGKVAMNRPAGTLLTQPPRDFPWRLVTIPYSGQGRNISGRFWAQGLHVDAGSTVKDATWEVFKSLLNVDHQAGFCEAFGQPVTCLKAAQPKLLDRFKQQTGVDATAWSLQVQYSGQSGSGMLRYGNWPAVQTELTPLYADLQTNKIGVNEYADRATEIVDRLLLLQP